MGRYDVVIDTGPSYQTQRQEAAAALTELATRNPQLMQMAGDIIMLHHGRVIETGAAMSFFTTPKTGEAKKFLAGELLV